MKYIVKKEKIDILLARKCTCKAIILGIFGCLMNFDLQKTTNPPYCMNVTFSNHN